MAPKKPGRPRENLAPPKHPNNLAALLTAAKMTYAQLGQAIGMGTNSVGKRARGEVKIEFPDAEAMARVFRVPVMSIWRAGAHETRVPIRYSVHVFAEADTPSEFAQPALHEPPPTLKRPEELFGCVVSDDSCDRRYRRGATLWCRDAQRCEERGGMWVVVRRFIDPVQRNTLDIVAGVLQIGGDGDIEVAMRTNNKHKQGLVTIRRAHNPLGLADVSRAYVEAPDRKIDIVPRPGDEAEVLGIVEAETNLSFSLAAD